MKSRSRRSCTDTLSKTHACLYLVHRFHTKGRALRSSSLANSRLRHSSNCTQEQAAQCHMHVCCNYGCTIIEHWWHIDAHTSISHHKRLLSFQEWPNTFQKTVQLRGPSTKISTKCLRQQTMKKQMALKHISRAIKLTSKHD